MNRLRLIKTAYTALAALMLAACASEELMDGMVQDLPEGKYPLQIAGVSITAESNAEPWGADTPQSRVAENTTDGKSSHWEGDEIITVQLSGTLADGTTYTETGEYKVAMDDKKSLAPVIGKELYWHSTSEGTITAWYCYPAAAGDNTVDLSDQSNRLAYVLSTTPQTVQYGATDTQLNFSHKLAKIRVKFNRRISEIQKVEVYAHTSCKINPADGTLANVGSEGYIPMCKTTYSDGIYWEANVVPGYKIDNIQVNDKKCTITQSVTPTEAAKYYTMEISVTGGTYHPDELPEITDNGEYTISGTGTKTITINGSPKITLKDVTLTNANINITGGSPTLIIEGTNTFTNGSISLSNANVTIKGKNTDNIDENVLNISNGGIVSFTNDAKCGNIEIEGIKAEITSASMVAGIGSGYKGVCGNITINNSKIDVKGNSGSAAIGGGYLESECGNIEITNSDITASGSNNYDEDSAAIGCGASTSDTPCSSCKNITITLKDGQTKKEFEAKLTAFVYAEKVGLGGFDNGTQAANLIGEVGTITWKQADGTVIETIAARN